MKILAALTAAAAALAGTACADTGNEAALARLSGTWIETVQYNKDLPRTELEFSGGRVTLSNYYAEPITEDVQISKAAPDLSSFHVSYVHRYKVKKPNGRIVEYTDQPDILYHEENGRPILSIMIFEYDGRGEIVGSEYIRKEDFTDGFESDLRKKRNRRTGSSMYREPPRTEDE